MAEKKADAHQAVTAGTPSKEAALDSKPGIQFLVCVQGHAGTVPMIIRRDPLAAAAEAIYTVEQRCAHGSAHGGVILDPADSEAGAAASRDEAGLVCTVGSIAVWPGASNVIPASANFSVDIR